MAQPNPAKPIEATISTRLRLTSAKWATKKRKLPMEHKPPPNPDRSCEITGISMGEMRRNAGTPSPMNRRSEGTNTVVTPKIAMVIPASLRPDAVMASNSRPARMKLFRPAPLIAKSNVD